MSGPSSPVSWAVSLVGFVVAALIVVLEEITNVKVGNIADGL